MTPPTTLEGIERYLASGLIRGIGPVYARRLVRGFGETVFDIIDQQPERLRKCPASAAAPGRIVAGWAEQKVVREIMLFLHANGVGTARAVRIFKTYGTNAVQVMTEDPYRLARDIRGIGFRTADQIAAKLGIEKTATIRLRAGVSYALAEAMDEGHCGLPVEDLTLLAAKLLEVPAELIETALALELDAGTVVADAVEGRPCVFLAGLYRAEQAIAERLRVLATGSLPWPPIDAGRAIPWVEARTGLALADSQRRAVQLALGRKVVVVTGGPGVGKTTLLNSILRILMAKQVGIALCAPTGRAAKRLSESTGLAAKTIHRLLETDPRTGAFRRDEGNPLPGAVPAGDSHFTQLRPPPAATLVTHGNRQRLPLPDQHHQPLASRDAGVEQVARQHGVVLRRHRDHHRRVFGALALVDRRGIGQHQFVQFAETVADLPAVEVGDQLALGRVDAPHDPKVAVVDIAIVVVLDLHDLVARTEGPAEALHPHLPRRI